MTLQFQRRQFTLKFDNSIETNDTGTSLGVVLSYVTYDM